MNLPDRYPIDGTLELTLRCNLHCKMCMFRHADSEPLQDRELTCDQWLTLARQLRDAGTLSLLLTGGEPMIRKDFIRLYEGIYRLGFILTLYTNATLLTPQILACLQKHPPHRIGVTLYGTCNEDYRNICMCSDGFDRAMAGIEQLQALPSALELRFTPTQDTIEKFADLDKLLFERFGIHATLSGRIFGAVRGGCMEPAHCRPTPEQTVEATWGQIENRLRQDIPAQLRQKVQLKISDRCALSERTATLLGCNAGMRSYCISWDGKLLGCQILEAFQTDALTEGFQNAWERFPETVKLPPHPCENCEHLQSCTLCPAVAMAETGSLTGVPEYICQITKLTQKRKEAFTL